MSEGEGRLDTSLTRLLMSVSQTSWLNTTTTFSMLEEADRESIRWLGGYKIRLRGGGWVTTVLSPEVSYPVMDLDCDHRGEVCYWTKLIRVQHGL